MLKGPALNFVRTFPNKWGRTGGSGARGLGGRGRGSFGAKNGGVGVGVSDGRGQKNRNFGRGCPKKIEKKGRGCGGKNWVGVGGLNPGDKGSIPPPPPPRINTPGALLISILNSNKTWRTRNAVRSSNGDCEKTTQHLAMVSASDLFVGYMRSLMGS